MVSRNDVLGEVRSREVSRARDWLYPSLIAVVGLVTFGLYVITDTRVGDDWLYLKWMENHEWDAFAHFHQFYNNLPQAALLWPFSYFPDVELALRIASVATIIAIGILVYLICLTTRYCKPIESFFIAAIAVCYPAYMWHISVIYTDFYYLPVLLFYLGFYLALVSERGNYGKRQALRLGALVLFLYSFHTGSLLAYFYGAAIIHICIIARERSLSWSQAVWFYCTRRAYFALCPLAFRFGYLFLVHSYITNAIALDPLAFGTAAAAFFSTMLLQARNVFDIGPTSGAFIHGSFARAVIWSFAALVLAALAARWLRWPRSAPIGGLAGRRLSAIKFGIGLILLCSSIVGYVAVAKAPDPDAPLGYATRVLLLAQVPIAATFVSLAELLFAQPFQGLLAYPLLFGIIASSAQIQIRENLRWQYYGVLDRSFALDLSTIEAARDITYFIVVDRANFMGWIHHPVASLPFEIAQIFHGPTHVFGELAYNFDLANAYKPQKTLSQLVAEYASDPQHNLVELWRLVLPTVYKQGVLLVCWGPGFTAITDEDRNRLVWAYQHDRWLKPNRLPGLLVPLLELHLATADHDSAPRTMPHCDR